MSNRTMTDHGATVFMVDLSGMARDVGSEDWAAGGALGEIIDDLRREGHLTDDLYAAGGRLVHDMTRCHGSSSAWGVGAYGERIGRGDGVSRRADFDAFQRMAAVLARLREHERTLLAFCILSRELERGKLADWGRKASSYKTRQQCKAFAVGQIRSMLETVADAYAKRPGMS